MNGKFRIAVLILIGAVVLAGAVGTVLSRDNSSSILGLCTLVCVSLLAILHQDTSNKLGDIAKETTEQTQVIAQVKRQTDGLTKELVRKSEVAAFAAGKEAGTEHE